MISDPEINDPEEGEKVCFMPDHVDSTDHKDAEYGVVTNVGNAGIMVDFNDGSGVSKLCYRRHLLRVGSTIDHPEV